MSCTHCGLCLESCPTYTLWGTEADSPRGRIVLIEEALAPGGSATVEMATHIDSCLGCMACMSVCPEDVPYVDLLASARSAIERQVHRPARERLRRQAALTALPRAAHAARLGLRTPIPNYTPAQGAPRGRVGLLLGCVQRVEHRAVHKATLAVLAAEGYEVIAPRLPDCCGALELHSGQRNHGVRRAEATIAAFAGVGGVDHVLTSAGGCGVAMKQYGRLLGTPEARAFSALVLDIHELLVQRRCARAWGHSPSGSHTTTPVSCATARAWPSHRESSCDESRVSSWSNCRRRREHAAERPASTAPLSLRPPSRSRHVRRRRSSPREPRWW